MENTTQQSHEDTTSSPTTTTSTSTVVPYAATMTMTGDDNTNTITPSSSTSTQNTPRNKVRVAGVDGECDCLNYATAPHRKKKCIFNRLDVASASNDSHIAPVQQNIIEENEDYGRVLDHPTPSIINMTGLDESTEEIPTNVQTHHEVQTTQQLDDDSAIRSLHSLEPSNDTQNTSKSAEVSLHKIQIDVVNESHIQDSNVTSNSDLAPINSQSNGEQIPSEVNKSVPPKTVNSDSSSKSCCILM